MRNNEITEMNYETIHKLMIRQILDQAPPSLSPFIKRSMEVIAASFHQIKLQISEDTWVIELGQYTQGFKPGSFSAEYKVYCLNEILWSGQVFMDPDQMSHQAYENYRENKLLSSLETLEVLTQATLTPELTIECVESYLRDQLAVCSNKGIYRLLELKELKFKEIEGVRLSDVFEIELENVRLYGFFQEIGQVKNEEQTWAIYQLYAGLRKGKCYPLATRPGIKSVFHFVRTLGACWIAEESHQTLLDQMAQAFEAIQWLEEQCMLMHQFAYQVEAIRREHKIEITRLTAQQDFSKEVLEETLVLITELQDLIYGRLPLDEMSWQNVLLLMEELELWFILEYQGFQPFDEELMAGVLEMIERVSIRSSHVKRWLMDGMKDATEEVSEVIPGHYELSATLQFQPLTVSRAIELLEAIVHFLKEFHKIDYIDLSYREEMN